MKIPTKLKKVEKQIWDTANQYDIEFDCFLSKDGNNVSYYYVHIKPRGERTNIEKNIINLLCKNKIRYSIVRKDKWKTLIFIPVDQKINYLVHSEEWVSKVNQYSMARFK